MANAWCINAYNCDGCLIQTLQTLDSACIGVGVQYTAPNPLDDKRLDYIKYTDKCGCTCCLSWENEILIYATDWVIKNLTLTNDDVNEAIKIQWNDIFWSNRAKTIVRYKTGSAPVSITDWTLAVEETTKNQYSSTPFSLTGVLDETTYYFTAFAVDSSNNVIDYKNWTVTTDFWWKPDVSRTLLYLPLESDTNDYSWNNRICTPTSVTFTTVWWVQSAHVWNTWWIAVTPTWFIDHNTPYRTVSVLVYVTAQTSSARRSVCERAIQNKMHYWINLKENTADIDAWWTVSNSIITNSRMHIVATWWDWYKKIYINWELRNTQAMASWEYPRWNRENSFQQGQIVLNWRNWVSSNQALNWNAREIIFENILWSDTDVAKYYSYIKSKFSIA